MHRVHRRSAGHQLGLDPDTHHCQPDTSRTTTAPATSNPPTSTSSPVTNTTSPTGTGSAAACRATYSVAAQGPGGYLGTVTITAGSAAVRGWQATWTLPAGETASQAWGATLVASGSVVSATSLSWNGSLSAGASTSFGFIGAGTGAPVTSVACTAS